MLAIGLDGSNKQLLLGNDISDKNSNYYKIFQICCIHRPPPLCGAVQADAHYIARAGDKVAARVRSQDAEENWILAEVVSFNTATNKYDVDDIDAEEGKE